MLFRVWHGVDQFYAKIAEKKFIHLSLKLLNNQQRAGPVKLDGLCLYNERGDHKRIS